MNRIRKFTRGICTIIAIFTLLLCLTGCGEEQIARAVVENNLSGLKTMDIDAVKENSNLEELILMKLKGVTVEDYLKSTKNIFSGIEYEILSVDKVNSKKVLVRTRISNRNMKPAIEEWATESVGFVYSHLASLEDMSDEELNREFIKTLEECTANVADEIVTKEMDVVVIKDRGIWKIDIDRELLDTVYGGAIDSFETMALTINAMS